MADYRLRGNDRKDQQLGEGAVTTGKSRNNK